LGAAQSRDEIYGAEINFTKALQGDEADPDYWFNMGYLEWKGGAFFQAADKFRAVLDRSRVPADARAAAGWVAELGGGEWTIGEGRLFFF